MKRKIIWSAALFVVVLLATSKTSHAVYYGGGVTCNTFLNMGCDGVCQDDVCTGPGAHSVAEYACSDGSILYVNE